MELIKRKCEHITMEDIDRLIEKHKKENFVQVTFKFDKEMVEIFIGSERKYVASAKEEQDEKQRNE